MNLQHVNPKLLAFARSIGAPLSDRTITRGTQEPINFWISNKYHGPLEEDDWQWTGTSYYNGHTIATRRDRKPFLDHDLLHELIHWLLASDQERKLPEFGLGSARLPLQAQVEASCKLDKANELEIIAQAGCCIIGKHLGISPELGDEPGWDATESWIAYQAFKRHEGITSKLVEEWAPLFLSYVPEEVARSK